MPTPDRSPRVSRHQGGDHRLPSLRIAPKPVLVIPGPEERRYVHHRSLRWARAEAQRLAIKHSDAFTVYHRTARFDPGSPAPDVAGPTPLAPARQEWVVIAEARNRHQAAATLAQARHMAEAGRDHSGEAHSVFRAVAKYKPASAYGRVLEAQRSCEIDSAQDASVADASVADASVADAGAGEEGAEESEAAL